MPGTRAANGLWYEVSVFLQYKQDRVTMFDFFTLMQLKQRI